MRLQRGDNPKIDRINDLVEMAQSDNDEISSYGLEQLLEKFHPMILKICSKWSSYFNDESHRTIQWDVLISDAQYWFIYYTKNKYTIDGQATYNKFIHDHMDSRIRYIYSKEIKYRSRHIFPDPDKNADDDNGSDMLDNVVFNYSDAFDGDNMIDDIITEEKQETFDKLATILMGHINNTDYFSPRESSIFHECMINGRTHQEISVEMGISRARVSQIMNRIRTKITDIMLEQPEWWEVF